MSSVYDYIKERIIKIGKYIVEIKKIVCVIVKEFGVLKSIVYKDLIECLSEINFELVNEVKEIFDYYKFIWYLCGGEVIKLKYKKEEEIVKWKNV